MLHSLLQFSPEEMMNHLEMLSAREQLMEDIDCIIEANFGEVEYKDDVVRMLCDAVCSNFPSN
jgi:3-hydroxyacyl-CoA dehydrogenase